jgi:hypothetical protein
MPNQEQSPSGKPQKDASRPSPDVERSRPSDPDAKRNRGQ